MNKDKLQKYAEHGFNVLLEGSHGLGKTAVIKEVFESLDLKWKYFSAATMDPWIDFIGVPKTVMRDNLEVLELIKPVEFANDEVEALFFDEFNRAPPKVMNAVMELIQFKSINGRKFNNLKLVWAAINPHDEDGTYSVEQLDPAVKDRFHIQIKIPLELDNSYLNKTHGDLAKPFIKWWNELPVELKREVSPRRLDYGISVYKAVGDIRNVFATETNVKKLEEYIKQASLDLDLKLLDKMDVQELKDFFTLENTIRYAEQILKSKNHVKLVIYFHKDFVETTIQLKNGSALKTLMLKEAIQNDDFFNTLSNESQKIIDTTKTKGVLQKGHIDYAIEKSLIGIMQDLKGRRVTWFVPKIASIFNTYCISLRKNKSTDIVSFFEVLFNTKDDQGTVLAPNLLNALASYQNSSSYIPNTKEDQLFLGLLLNFAVKYLKTNKLDLEPMKLAINSVFKTYAKYRVRANNLYAHVVLGFEENHWSILKDAFEKKTDWVSVANTVKARDAINLLKVRDEATLKYSNVTSWNDAYDLFSTKSIV